MTPGDRSDRERGARTRLGRSRPKIDDQESSKGAQEVGAGRFEPRSMTPSDQTSMRRRDERPGLDLVDRADRLLLDDELLALRLESTQFLERDVALHQVAWLHLGERRLGHLAQSLDHPWAPGVEHASARWVRRARHLAVEPDARSLLAIDVRHR